MATAGASALVIVAMLGNRTDFPADIKPPHNPGMTMIGASMLWVGWFGFNGGSALAADGSAALAITVTQISAATASLVWMITEWVKFGQAEPNRHGHRHHRRIGDHHPRVGLCRSHRRAGPSESSPDWCASRP